MAEHPYVNVREIMGHFIGCRVVDITQHDEDEFAETQVSYVALHFDNGLTVTFQIGKGMEFVVETAD